MLSSESKVQSTKYSVQSKDRFEARGSSRKGISMSGTYTAIIKHDGDWWIGWVEEIPGTNCQESTREELIESLKIVLQEALEFMQ